MQIVTQEVLKTAHVTNPTIEALTLAKQQIERYKTECQQNPRVRFGFQVVFKLPVSKPFTTSTYSFPDSSAITQFFNKMPVNLKPRIVGYDPVNRTITLKGFFVDFLLTMMIQDFNQFNQRKFTY
ncbi:hypothetical protein JCM30760_07810 [Thiomicrorhabdus hydrogeniphila]